DRLRGRLRTPRHCSICESDLLDVPDPLSGVTADLRPSTALVREMRSAMSTGGTTATRLRQGTAYDPLTSRSTSRHATICENTVTPCGTYHAGSEGASDGASGSTALSVAAGPAEAAAIDAIVARACARLSASSSRRWTSAADSSEDCASPPWASSFAPPRPRRPRRREDFAPSSPPPFCWP